MADIKIRFQNEPLGRQFKRNIDKQRGKMGRALLGAAQDYSAEFLKQGRANIASAGNFKSARWQQGLFADVVRGSGNIVVNIGHKVGYWIVFQKGKTIRGKPLLWIPLSFGDAKGVRARDFPGKLFRVDRKNGLAPLLMSKDGRPQYVGKKSVRIPKKFRVLEIGRELSRKIGQFYKARLQRDKG
jgi:hypothetical protein